MIVYVWLNLTMIATGLILYNMNLRGDHDSQGQGIRVCFVIYYPFWRNGLVPKGRSGKDGPGSKWCIPKHAG